MNLATIHYFIYALIAISNTEGAKILIIVPYGGISHNIFIRAIAEGIASRGHEITYYSTLDYSNEVTNIRDIKLNNTINNFMATYDFDSMRTMSRSPVFNLPFIFHVGLQIADKGLNDPILSELINSDEKYDLILLETHIGQEAFLAFGHKFQAPIVSWNPFFSFFCVDESSGNPFGTAYIPTFELPYTERMTFFQRVHNAIRTFVFFTAYHLYYLPKQENIMRTHFKYPGSERIPPIGDMLQNISLFILNSQSSVDYPRPLVPNVIPAGGAHISSSRKPLPQDLKEFIENSHNGVIYVSFGSFIPSEQMPDDMRQTFVRAFGKLKQNVLWKFGADSVPGLPKNVKLSKWLPQHDILAHPNCLAFITHGGLLSQEEAVYFGVPLIGVPIFADQYLNVARAVYRGFAVHVEKYNITEESILWAVKEVVNKPSYRETAKRYSDIFRDNPLHPVENAAYWIEYVLRQKGAPHLQSEGRNLPYYKYLLLDVIAFIVSTVLFLSIFVYKMVKFTYNRIFSKHSKLNKVTDRRKKRE